MAETQEILFGSGDLYIVTSDIDIETGLVTQAEIDASCTKIGETSGEATLTVENEFLDIRGGVKNQILKSVQTSETVTFNAGIVTYSLKNISEFLAGYFQENEALGYRKLGIGGKTSVPIKKLLFVHTKEDGYKLMMLMHKAQNRAGLEWTFSNEENTPFSFEFTLLADTTQTEGNLVTIVEEFEPILG